LEDKYQPVPAEPYVEPPTARRVLPGPRSRAAPTVKRVVLRRLTLRDALF